MHVLIKSLTVSAIVGLGMVALAVGAWALLNDGGTTVAKDSTRPFDTIDENDLAVPVTFERLAQADAPDAMSESEIRVLIGTAVEVPMREPPRLVRLVGNPFPDTRGADGPLWAFLPDIPLTLGGPVPEGVETYVLQLYNASTGELILEFGGPIRDGENEWHPDFPQELRYGIDDQVR